MEPSLLSLRSTVVLLLAVLTGVGTGVLSLVGGSAGAVSVLHGAAAAGLAVPFFNGLVARETHCDRARETRSGRGRDGGHG
ncbi:hypothetical protein ACFV6E_03815 [Streptomyces sp. NPDC059785]|uniref:hypothetical protein n=1 Tax=unclassified Streptomyces TaxID=2593676 RepID=UPI003664F492